MAKDSSRTTAGEFWGQKTFKKNYQKAPTSPHVVWEGFKKKKSRKENDLTKKQSPAYSVVRHDWNFKWDWRLWSDVTKKLGFLAANTQDGFGEHRDKKYPMCTMKYAAVFLMLWAYISAGGPGNLV